MNELTTLRIEDKGAVRLVHLDRPDALNALNTRMTDDLTDLFQSSAEDSSVKVVVLTGAGKAFWAGADLKEMGQSGLQRKHDFKDMMDAIIDFPKPILLAVNGVGVGIGATICGLVDLVFMSTEARLRCPFSSLGLTAEAGSTITFRQLMGRQQASWFLLAGEWMDAEACVKAGLAVEAVAPDDLLPHTLAQAEKLAALPVSSLITTKRLIMDPIREPLKAAVTRENAGLAALVGSPANQEALSAFREKREPDFKAL